MQTLINDVVQWATHLIGAWGLPAVFLLMLLESACIPVPSEAIMPFAGFAVSEGTLTFLGIVVAGDAGHHDAEEGEGPLAHREPGERHDGLAGHRYAGALEEHEEEDRRQPPGADEVRRPLNDVVDEGLHAA